MFQISYISLTELKIERSALYLHTQHVSCATNIQLEKLKTIFAISVFSARRYIQVTFSFYNPMFRNFCSPILWGYWTRIRRDGSYVVTASMIGHNFRAIKHHRCEILSSLCGQRKMSAKIYFMSKADVTGQPQGLFPVSPSLSLTVMASLASHCEKQRCPSANSKSAGLPRCYDSKVWNTAGPASSSSASFFAW